MSTAATSATFASHGMRADLLALSPEALAHAANMGLVKRAQRELENAPPQLETRSDLSVIARFGDGVETRWAANVPMKEASCSCGAPNACRHRIMLVLAYRAQSAESAPVIDSPASSEDALRALFAPAILKVAHQLLAQGLSIDVRRVSAPEPCPTARLPNATVRYWTGSKLAGAQCDCIRGSMCEHVALGARAFLLADAESVDAPSLRVTLSAANSVLKIDQAPFHGLLHSLWTHGVEQGTLIHGQAFHAARAAAEKLGAVWLQDLLQELEAWAAAYAQRNARYEARQGVMLSAELLLRVALGQQASFTKAALGTGVAQEVLLDQLRLTCLGCRIDSDEAHMSAELVLADIETGTKFVLQHSWKIAGAASEAVSRASPIAPGVRLSRLALGQLIARGAKRFANGTIKLARARGDQNSLLPQTGNWIKLSAPLRFSALTDLADEMRQRLVSALSPRHALPNFCVMAISAVESLAYDASEQTLYAVVSDQEGQQFWVERTHQSHAPHALDAITAALNGRHGRVHHVAGTMIWQNGHWSMTPWAIAADRIVVPDIEGASGALAEVSLGSRGDGVDPHRPFDVTEALQQVEHRLADCVHAGLREVGGPQRLLELGKQLGLLGLSRLAHNIQVFGTALRSNDWPNALDQLAQLLIEYSLTRSALAETWAS